MNNLILGLGTGRCGTVSLQRLLSIQENTVATHEAMLLPWAINQNEYNNLVNHVNSFDAGCIAEIGSWYLPYAMWLMKEFDNTKCIILQRDRSEVINSFQIKTGNRNHWQTHNGMPCRYDKCFPKFDDAKSKGDAIGEYWDLYYKICEMLPQENCFWIDTNNLNNELKVKEMLQFCEISHPIYKQIKANSNGI